MDFKRDRYGLGRGKSSATPSPVGVVFTVRMVPHVVVQG